MLCKLTWQCPPETRPPFPAGQTALLLRWVGSVARGDRETDRQAYILTTEVLQDEVELVVCLEGILQVHDERMLMCACVIRNTVIITSP